MRVLIVDDEPAVRQALKRALDLEGFEVELAENGEQALVAAAGKEPDAVILDVMMPGLDGIQTCRKLRASGSRVPILMLTAKVEVEDRVAGLDAGADDYLVKPFALAELLARLRALLRRSGQDTGELLRFSDVELDPAQHEVRRQDEPLELTRTEFSLLEMFLRHPKQVLSRSQIFEAVWGYDFGYNSNSLDVYIGYLRKKLEASGQPRLIQTLRGVGYVLREPDRER
jgi:two-component system response regulator MprA